MGAPIIMFVLGRRCCVTSHQLQRACQIARHATRARPGRASSCNRAPAHARETRAPDVSTNENDCCKDRYRRRSPPVTDDDGDRTAASVASSPMQCGTNVLLVISRRPLASSYRTITVWSCITVAGSLTVDR